jgi:hypothetical protein
MIQKKNPQPLVVQKKKMSDIILESQPVAAEPAAETPKPKRAPRKRKAAEESDAQPKAQRTKSSSSGKASTKAKPSTKPAGKAAPKPEAKPNATEEKTPHAIRSANSNPKGHEAARRKKQDRLDSTFLKFVNSIDPTGNVKVTKRLNRKTVEEDGVRVLAFGQSVCEHELRFLTQKFGTPPTQPAKRKSGYMNFTKVMRAEWAKNPKYMNVDKKNPNGSKAIVSDIAKEWKSLGEEDKLRYTNMSDEELASRIAAVIEPVGVSM